MLSKLWDLRDSKKKASARGTTYHVAKGDAFNRENNWFCAIEHYKEALALDPKLCAIWVQLGHGYRETNQLAAAEEAYEKALALEPDNDDAWFFLGVTFKSIGREREAFDAFSKALHLNVSGPARDALAAEAGVSKNDIKDFLLAIDELLEPDTYLKLNHDLRVAGVEPKQHYVLYGWREGRAMSSWFDSVYYGQKYRKLVGKAPPLLHYWRTGRALKLRASPYSSKPWFEPQAPEVSAWEALAPARSRAATRAVVILPVYKGYDETLASVYHALHSRGASEYSLLVINDCGPDPELNGELERLSSLGLFDYVVNDANRGFVQTCNRGILELSGDKDVILLNSDAYVPPGWFDRMIAHADRDASIATITPLSNNATICSYPVTDAENIRGLELSPAALDGLAATTNAGLCVETPTGVGFCFYMRRKIIDELGALDPVAFKLGYGEENDFCMRALEAGYKNVIAQDIFVYHVGSVSFSAAKDANFDAGQKALARKHPNYTLLTRRHVMADPGRYSRMRLDAARLVQTVQAPVIFITHSWGGGIETYLQTKRAELDERGRPHLTIRVKDRCFLYIETGDEPYVFIPNLLSIDLRLDFELFADLFRDLSPSLIHVNSFAGLDWTHHKALLDFIRSSRIPYRYVGHDYSAVSRFYHLTRPDNIYIGLPDWNDIGTWSRMVEHGPQDIGDVEERRHAYEAFLKSAEAVEFPSAAARDVLLRFYPDLTAEVVPHMEPFKSTESAVRRKPDGRIRISSIGAIGPHKGSDVLLALARDASSRNLPIDYSIIGYSDQDAAMRDAGVFITGAYASEQEVVEHLAEIQPDLVILPSVWPETYCYTLSIPLGMRLPLIVFDLGAQAERAAAVDWSVRLDPLLINAPTKISEALLSLDVDDLWANTESQIDVRGHELRLTTT